MDLRALGGQDPTVVNDLTGTDVREVDIDLAPAIGGGTGDGLADRVTVNGTSDPDSIAVGRERRRRRRHRAFTAIGISHAEVANDSLAINGLGGDDDVTIGGGVAALIQTLVDLGADE